MPAPVKAIAFTEDNIISTIMFIFSFSITKDCKEKVKKSKAREKSEDKLKKIMTL